MPTYQEQYIYSVQVNGAASAVAQLQQLLSLSRQAQASMGGAAGNAATSAATAGATTSGAATSGAAAGTAFGSSFASTARRAMTNVAVYGAIGVGIGAITQGVSAWADANVALSNSLAELEVKLGVTRREAEAYYSVMQQAAFATGQDVQEAVYSRTIEERVNRPGLAAGGMEFGLVFPEVPVQTAVGNLLALQIQFGASFSEINEVLLDTVQASGLTAKELLNLSDTWGPLSQELGMLDSAGQRTSAGMRDISGLMAGMATVMGESGSTIENFLRKMSNFYTDPDIKAFLAARGIETTTGKTAEGLDIRVPFMDLMSQISAQAQAEPGFAVGLQEFFPNQLGQPTQQQLQELIRNWETINGIIVKSSDTASEWGAAVEASSLRIEVATSRLSTSFQGLVAAIGGNELIFNFVNSLASGIQNQALRIAGPPAGYANAFETIKTNVGGVNEIENTLEARAGDRGVFELTIEARAEEILRNFSIPKELADKPDAALSYIESAIDQFSASMYFNPEENGATMAASFVRFIQSSSFNEQLTKQVALNPQVAPKEYVNAYDVLRMDLREQATRAPEGAQEPLSLIGDRLDQLLGSIRVPQEIASDKDAAYVNALDSIANFVNANPPADKDVALAENAARAFVSSEFFNAQETGEEMGQSFVRFVATSSFAGAFAEDFGLLSQQAATSQVQTFTPASPWDFTGKDELVSLLRSRITDESALGGNIPSIIENMMRNFSIPRELATKPEAATTYAVGAAQAFLKSEDFDPSATGAEIGAAFLKFVQSASFNEFSAKRTALSGATTEQVSQAAMPTYSVAPVDFTPLTEQMYTAIPAISAVEAASWTASQSIYDMAMAADSAFSLLSAPRVEIPEGVSQAQLMTEYTRLMREDSEFSSSTGIPFAQAGGAPAFQPTLLTTSEGTPVTIQNVNPTVMGQAAQNADKTNRTIEQENNKLRSANEAAANKANAAAEARSKRLESIFNSMFDAITKPTSVTALDLMYNTPNGTYTDKWDEPVRQMRADVNNLIAGKPNEYNFGGGVFGGIFDPSVLEFARGADQDTKNSIMRDLQRQAEEAFYSFTLPPDAYAGGKDALIASAQEWVAGKKNEKSNKATMKGWLVDAGLGPEAMGFLDEMDEPPIVKMLTGGKTKDEMTAIFSDKIPNVSESVASGAKDVQWIAIIATAISKQSDENSELLIGSGQVMGNWMAQGAASAFVATITPQIIAAVMSAIEGP